MREDVVVAVVIIAAIVAIAVNLVLVPGCLERGPEPLP